MDTHDRDPHPERPPYDPVAETKSKLTFAAVVFGGMIIVKLLTGW